MNKNDEIAVRWGVRTWLETANESVDDFRAELNADRAADPSTLESVRCFLTVDEAAELLRTTRRAVYAMVERRQLPGVVRLRRRVLFRSDVLLDWLDQKRAPSPKE